MHEWYLKSMARTRSKNPSPKIPNETEILRILHSNNPWWSGRPIPTSKIKEFKRRDYYKLEKQLEHNKISALIGARQVGKTTLMYQLIQKILSQTSPQNVLLVQVDDIYLQITIESLEKIFNVYAANIIKTPLGELDNIVYIFLDEIQSLQGWQDALKKWYDLGYKIKFIISGSSSIDIIDGMSESLGGPHQIPSCAANEIPRVCKIQGTKFHWNSS